MYRSCEGRVESELSGAATDFYRARDLALLYDPSTVKHAFVGAGFIPARKRVYSADSAGGRKARPYAGSAG